MGPAMMWIYHKLPSPFRDIGASLQGYYLRSWRYSRDTEQLVSEALDRDTWSLDRWKNWQEERLAYILNRAATKIPYYRQMWEKRRRDGDRVSWEYLERWPILAKNIVRENPKAFVANDCDIRKMFVDRTSGTTGTPLQIFLTRQTIQAWYALYEARVRRWNGVSIHENWIILGGQLVIPFKQKKPPFWVHNYPLNQLYFSTHHISRENSNAYLRSIEQFKPSHMIVYPSSASILADLFESAQLQVPAMKVVISNAEFLSDTARERLGRVFQCPVRNTYGMAEIAVMATECSNGHLHLWPEAGYTEIVSDQEDYRVDTGQVGRIIATSLLNADMPLIRYETGDRGSLDASIPDCEKKLPVLKSVEGRLNDLIVTLDGRYIFWLNPVFYGLPVLEAQIIQERLDYFHIRLVSGNNYSAETGLEIIKRLQQRVGEVKVVLEEVSTIPRLANGKFRAVISNVNVNK